ncbi:hypothetical protein HC891_12415 [Candidatus Gracilibacteria bacterium]|nr:hypothetical protein [Candidatus Gracilibacteria bacterium]
MERFDWMMYIALMLAVVIGFAAATLALLHNNTLMIMAILVYLVTHMSVYWLYRHHRTRKGGVVGEHCADQVDRRAAADGGDRPGSTDEARHGTGRTRRGTCGRSAHRRADRTGGRRVLRR